MGAVPAVRTKLNCDFCDADVESVHVFEHSRFKLLSSGTLLHSQEAGYMGACDQCRPLVEAKDLDRLLERAREGGVYCDAVRHFHAQVLKHLTGYTFESRVGEPDRKPRFFVHRCPQCGHETRIDSATYDQTLSFHCANCGVSTTLISHAPGPTPKES